MSRSPRRHVVRIDPGIWRDADFADALSIPARSVWFSSLIYLASTGDPDGLYPHGELTADTGPEAEAIAKELIAFGLWCSYDEGYQVQPYGGCRVLPEVRQSIPREVREMVYRRDGYRCVECDSPNQLTCDHKTPWSHGGSDDPSNLQTMCQSCNSRKGARV